MNLLLCQGVKYLIYILYVNLKKTTWLNPSDPWLNQFFLIQIWIIAWYTSKLNHFKSLCLEWQFPIFGDHRALETTPTKGEQPLLQHALKGWKCLFKKTYKMQMCTHSVYLSLSIQSHTTHISSLLHLASNLVRGDLYQVFHSQLHSNNLEKICKGRIQQAIFSLQM